MVNLRLIGALVAALAGVALGWNARGIVADRELAQERQAYTERLVALQQEVVALQRERAEVAKGLALAADEAMRESAQWRSRARAAEEGLKRARADMDRVRLGVQKEIDRAEAVAGARCELGAEWVRLYDGALRAAGGGAPDPAGSATGGVTGAAAGAEIAVTEWQVMRTHADNAALLGECRARLEALQSWARSVTDQGGQ